MSGRIERATRDPHDGGDARNHSVASLRLPATLPRSTRAVEAVTGGGRSVLYRLTAAALAQADQIRAAGRAPRVTGWSEDASAEPTQDNPRGLPTITITAVR